MSSPQRGCSPSRYGYSRGGPSRPTIHRRTTSQLPPALEKSYRLGQSSFIAFSHSQAFTYLGRCHTSYFLAFPPPFPRSPTPKGGLRAEPLPRLQAIPAPSHLAIVACVAPSSGHTLQTGVPRKHDGSWRARCVQAGFRRAIGTETGSLNCRVQHILAEGEYEPGSLALWVS